MDEDFCYIFLSDCMISGLLMGKNVIQLACEMSIPRWYHAQNVGGFFCKMQCTWSRLCIISERSALVFLTPVEILIVLNENPFPLFGCSADMQTTHWKWQTIKNVRKLDWVLNKTQIKKNHSDQKRELVVQNSCFPDFFIQNTEKFYLRAFL